jgi:hypothetical protein
MPHYVVRHLAGQFEELPCLVQIEDEGAAMYFNIIHGMNVSRRFTTKTSGKRCEDYLLVARELRAGAVTEEREITLFDVTPSAAAS